MKRIVLLIALILAPALSFAQTNAQQNEAGNTYLPNNGNISQNIAVDRALRQIVTIASGTNGPQSVIPVSNAVGFNGVGAIGVGYQFVGADAAEADSTTTVINATAHAARVGDILSFRSGTAGNIGIWVTVSAVATNSITLANALLATPAAADGFYILRPQPLSVNANNGNSAFNSLNVSIASEGQPILANGILKLEDGVAGSLDAGVAIFQKLQSALSVDAAANDYSTLKGDLDGRLITSLTPAGESWRGCGTATATTADVAIKAAVASNRNYVTSITCASSDADNATNINFKDGSTVMAVGGVNQMATTSAGTFTATFPVPLRGTVNTAFNFNTAVSTSSVICCASGYISVN
jgi:hypothetical protein